MLSNEDNLRLNVLVSQSVHAIRINESSMVLSALTDKGEARIELAANDKHDAYLRDVRDFLSEHYLGMPGGFPRHIERWSRMGKTQHSQDKMLLLGEPEAIIALAYSNCLSIENAQYAWWAYQSPEIARNLLKCPDVVPTSLGKELAQFLMAFLPFEERPLDVVEGVKLILQADLISAQEKANMWQRAQRKNPYFVGFMLAGAQAIPLDETPHPRHQELQSLLKDTSSKDGLSADNPYALALLHFLSSDGRKWLNALTLALQKPMEQNIVVAIFITLDQELDLSIGPKRGVLEIDQAKTLSQSWCFDQPQSAPQEAQQLLAALDQPLRDKFHALIILAQIGENTLNKLFGGRDFGGTVMRKHLSPLSSELNIYINTILEK